MNLPCTGECCSCHVDEYQNKHIAGTRLDPPKGECYLECEEGQAGRVRHIVKLLEIIC